MNESRNGSEKRFEENEHFIGLS